MDEIFTKNRYFFSTCFTIKEGANGKNIDSTVILQARGVWKSLFSVSTPKETKDKGLALDEQFTIVSFLSFP